ncbi:MAG: heavy metal translocating P-type ATPase [Vibrio sp.]
MRHYALTLSGLHCMGCARKLERQLHQDIHDIVIHELSPTFIELDAEATFRELLQSMTILGYTAGNDYTFSLQGLHCGGCVKTLTQYLEPDEDIANLTVTKETLSLTTPRSKSDIQQKVSDAGYQAIDETTQEENITSSDTPMQTTDTHASEQGYEHTSATQNNDSISLMVEGMSCASCVSSVEKAILSVQGVTRAQVNLAEQSALAIGQVEDTDALIDAITQAGYHAHRVDDPADQQRQQQDQLMQTKKHHLRNAILGLATGLPLMLWGVFGGDMSVTTDNQRLVWGLVGLVCFGVLATAGRHFYVNAWRSLMHKRATMDTLVALGTAVAWLYSMAVIIIPTWFPSASRHVYFEASAMIIGLISLGHYIETKAKARTTHSLQALIKLQPNQATVIREGKEQTISADQIQQGMQLRIKPGEKFPVDGAVLSGESYVDEAMLTGEPMPVHKGQSDTVSAGTLNQDGTLVIEATNIGAHTLLSRIIQMVRQAQSSKPKIATLADQISAVFVPVVIAIAIMTALIWYVIGPEPRLSYMLVAATSVLIIACPCALGLATPLSITVGVGKAAELGMLIKDADALQTASQISAVVFDKTGTLTQGQPSVQDATFVACKNDVIGLAYGLEQHSEHPLAQAICQYASHQSQAPAEASDFISQRGKGISATNQNTTVSMGSIRYMQDLGVDLTDIEATLERYQANAWTPVLIAREQDILGCFAISDPLREDSLDTVRALNAQGIHTVMLTGDNQTVAEAIASQLEVQQVIAGVLPDEKAQYVKQLQQQYGTVAMIGDGMNDAPALAQADVSMAMASGSDIAIDTAAITLLHSSPMTIVHSIALSQATMRNIKQNLLGAFFYNTLGIPLAAGILYPAFGFMLSPVVAGTAMALSSITVVTNANRLRWFTPKQQG